MIRCCTAATTYSLTPAVYRHIGLIFRRGSGFFRRQSMFAAAILSMPFACLAPACCCCTCWACMSCCIVRPTAHRLRRCWRWCRCRFFRFPRPYWGLGPIFSVTAGVAVHGLCAAAGTWIRSPRTASRWCCWCSSLPVFAGISIWFPAINLVLVMLVAMIGLGRFKLRVLALAGVSAVSAVAGAFPAIHHYYITYSLSGSFTAAFDAVAYSGQGAGEQRGQLCFIRAF